MQRLALGALVGQAPQGCELWLDGGHNAEGGRVVAAALGDLEERVSRPLVVIVGMMANTVPLRARLASGETVGSFLAQLQDRQAALMPHQHIGLGQIQREHPDIMLEPLIAG